VIAGARHEWLPAASLSYGEGEWSHILRSGQVPAKRMCAQEERMEMLRRLDWIDGLIHPSLKRQRRTLGKAVASGPSLALQAWMNRDYFDLTF
jgi:hypothetical protein